MPGFFYLGSQRQNAGPRMHANKKSSIGIRVAILTVIFTSVIAIENQVHGVRATLAVLQDQIVA